MSRIGQVARALRHHDEGPPTSLDASSRDIRHRMRSKPQVSYFSVNRAGRVLPQIHARHLTQHSDERHMGLSRYPVAFEVLRTEESFDASGFETSKLDALFDLRAMDKVGALEKHSKGCLDAVAAPVGHCRHDQNIGGDDCRHPIMARALALAPPRNLDRANVLIDPPKADLVPSVADADAED